MKKTWCIAAGICAVGAIIVGCITLRTYDAPDAAAARDISHTCKGARACIEASLMDIVRNDGVTAGYSTLRALYIEDVSFRPTCSFVSLDLGAAIYEAVPDQAALVFEPVSATCNYGLYQEYPRALLAATGDIVTAQKMCERVGESLGSSVSGAESECFRGIGRALPFIEKSVSGDVAGMAAYAVRECRAVAPDDTDYLTCLSGVFNILGRRFAGVGPSPTSLCGREKDGVVRARCYGNYNWSLVAPLDQADTEGTFRSINESYATTSPQAVAITAWEVGYERARIDLDGHESYDVSIHACMNLPGTNAASCIQGYSIGLAKHGIPGDQHTAIIAFCSEALKLDHALTKLDCPSPQAIEYLKGFYSPRAYEAACKEFDSRMSVSCAESMQTLGQ